ncbi:MAG: hypothetical protein IT285_01725 [Bdellovibrionales bacterium]|nr:hypothetical protein [Bdellovibrionales bacterium]
MSVQGLVSWKALSGFMSLAAIGAGLSLSACQRTPDGVMLDVSGEVKDQHGQPVTLRLEPWYYRAELCHRTVFAESRPDEECARIESLQNGHFRTQVEYRGIGKTVLGTEVSLKVHWTNSVGKGYDFKVKTIVGQVLETPVGGADVSTSFVLPTYFQSIPDHED